MDIINGFSYSEKEILVTDLKVTEEKKIREESSGSCEASPEDAFSEASAIQVVVIIYLII